MTWGGGKPHAVGDRGQRFEVTYVNPESDEPEKRRVFGWSDTQAGADGMVRSIGLHPVWTGAEIRDREICTWTRLPDLPDPLETRRVRFQASCTGAIAQGAHPIHSDTCPGCGRLVAIPDTCPGCGRLVAITPLGTGPLEPEKKIVTLDINEPHKLALVVNEDLSDPRYEPLTSEHRVSDRVALGYLAQYHTVANTAPMGIVTRERGFPRDGWTRLTELNLFKRPK